MLGTASLVTAALLAGLGHANSRCRCDENSIAHVDVAVIGGGAAGSFAAVQLKDAGKSVLLIEKDSALGGHISTSDIPLPGGGSFPLNWGVQAYLDVETTRSFFGRFDIPLMPVAIPASTTYPIDFTTGEPVPLPESDPVAVAAAVETYLGFCELWKDYILYGYTLPFPIPPELEDLVLPFGAFVAKHNLYPIVTLIHSVGLTYSGDMLSVPTIFVMGDAYAPQILALLPEERGGKPFLVPESGDNRDLYEAVLAYLDGDAWLNSKAFYTERHGGKVKLKVQKQGRCKIVKARKLLITIPPLPHLLGAFNIDAHESSIFSKWDWLSLYTTLLTSTGLPDSSTILNVSPNPERLFLPGSPFAHPFRGVVPEFFISHIVGGQSFSAENAKDLVIESLENMKDAGTFETTEPVFVGFSDHSPSSLTVTTEDLLGGFLKNAAELQGYKDTYWAGLAWASDYSPLIWIHVGMVLQQMLAELA